ncbi:MAG TPA: methionine adenosyltransferase [Patescibacteria group bacterium]|nr:methionine adenosyltransferase [Patescibacteria group bacterium]
MKQTDQKYVFTSESVTEGHPDKVCDQISDSILDELLKQDKDSHAGIECFVTTGLVVVGGEIRTKGYVDIAKIARATIKEIGYNNGQMGFSADDCGVIVAIDEQSPDISQGVDAGKGKFKEQGAGDQGLMFGFACRETKELMPLPIILAHKMAKRLAEVRKNKTLNYLRPDGKTQVAVEYRNGKPYRLDTVVVAAQHNELVSEARVEKDILKHVVRPVCGKYLDKKTKYFINATGKFIKGGPPADTGLTGRKIIVDTYGGHGSHGGGCFSGKDPSKVDRSASYLARYIAKNIVAARLADKCEVQLSYVIGRAEPVSVLVQTFGTGKIEDSKMEKIVRKHFPLKPAQIIRQLKLKRPIYKQTAAYGHFGRNEESFTWEKTDKVNVLRRYL